METTAEQRAACRRRPGPSSSAPASSATASPTTSRGSAGRDLVLLDKGPLPNPGGSTGHASNFIFPVDHSREMTALTRDSVRQYTELDVITVCGGIEVARTEERMEELRRRMSSAASWGVEDVRLVTPDEVKELVPFIDESVIVGGFYTPSVSVVDSLRAGTLMREAAQASGALTVSANTEVLGIDVEDGRVRRVRTTRGDVEAEYVVIACGVWSPRLARMAGAAHPAHPRRAPDDRHRPRAALRGRQGQHRVPDRARHGHEHVRAPGRRRARGRLLRAPADPARPGRDPVRRGGRALPDRVPLHAGRLRPADGARARADAGDRRRRVRGHQVRDQRPAVADAGHAADPGRDARGARAVVGRRGVDQGGARRRPRGRGVDGPRRAGDRPPGLRHRPLLRAPEEPRARQGAHVRGVQQDLRDRPSRRAVGVQPRRPPLPLPRARARARRGLLRGGRLGAPALVRVQRGPGGGVRRRRARGRVGVALVVADHQRRAPRHARPRGDVRPHLLLRLRRARAGRARLRAAGVRAPDGRAGSARSSTRRCSRRTAASAPTSRSCGSATSTSASSRAARTAWRTSSGSPTTPAPDAQVVDLTSSWCTLGLWGPRARDIAASLTRDDLSHEGFPFATCRTIEMGPLRVLASRISYVGDLGWELYVPMEQGARLWDMVAEAGAPHGIVPAGIGVYAHHGAAGEVLPRLRLRARRRVRRRRGRDGVVAR